MKAPRLSTFLPNIARPWRCPLSDAFAAVFGLDIASLASSEAGMDFIP